jgi:two-component system response regulator (stage 0 sporulation protein A)
MLPRKDVIEKHRKLCYFVRDASILETGGDFMEKGRVLIAEGSEELALHLSEMLLGSYQVRCCSDGHEAQKLLSQFRPDVLVLDVMLPGVDGLTLLQRALEQGIRTRVLLTTALNSDYILDAAARLGVGYIMRTPCELGAMAARVADLSRSGAVAAPKAKDAEAQTAGILRALGIRAKHRGSNCIREAVLLSMNEEYRSVTKVLYPEVARRCGCENSHVERNIRSAIEYAWTHRDENVWRMYFPPDGSGNVKRPTNADFIFRLADCVRRGQAG